MVLSRIPGEYVSDSSFPAWDPADWTLEGRTEYDRFTLGTGERRTDQ
jgi:dihydrofolate reductase